MAIVSHSKKETRGKRGIGALDPVTDQDMHDRDPVEVPSTMIPISFAEKQRLLESYALTKLIAGRGTHWNKTEK